MPGLPSSTSPLGGEVALSAATYGHKLRPAVGYPSTPASHIRVHIRKALLLHFKETPLPNGSEGMPLGCRPVSRNGSTTHPKRTVTGVAVSYRGFAEKSFPAGPVAEVLATTGNSRFQLAFSGYSTTSQGSPSEVRDVKGRARTKEKALCAF